MNCKYMNMLRVVRGNAFKLKIAVEAYTPSGRRIDSFALGEAVLKLDKNGTLTTKDYTILEGTTILVAFDGSDSLGVYGFQMSGEYEGEAWRWANAEIFQIVETNAKASIPEGCVVLDDTYNMALKIVLSGGDGVTFTPSVSEQGIISWTNDGGLPNPEPRNIRGPRGEQGPQGEVGPKGPRGQMGLRGQIGPKGDKGDKGDTGATPVLDVTASVDENVGNPMVVVESFGPAEQRTFDFQFKNLKGQKGETGATGPQGPQGQQGEPGNYTKPASGIPLSDLNGNVASGIVYDVTANNSGATFASLSALLSSGSLSTLIPTSVRKGGMQIRFVCSSDNNYVQFRYMNTDASTTATFTNTANWQGVDAEPTERSKNLVESGGVYGKIAPIEQGNFINKNYQEDLRLDLDGTEIIDDSYITTDYVDISEYGVIKVAISAADTNTRVVTYNSNKEFVEYYTLNGYTERNISTKDAEKYARVTFKSPITSGDTINGLVGTNFNILWEAETKTVNAFDTQNDVSELQNDVSELQNDVSELQNDVSELSTNVQDIDETVEALEEGEFASISQNYKDNTKLVLNNGVVIEIEDENYITTDYIDITSRTIENIKAFLDSSDANTALYIYNSNKEYRDRFSLMGYESSGRSITTQSSDTYVRVTFKKPASSSDTVAVNINSNYVTVWQPESEEKTANIYQLQDALSYSRKFSSLSAQGTVAAGQYMITKSAHIYPNSTLSAHIEGAFTNIKVGCGYNGTAFEHYAFYAEITATDINIYYVEAGTPLQETLTHGLTLDGKTDVTIVTDNDSNYVRHSYIILTNSKGDVYKHELLCWFGSGNAFIKNDSSSSIDSEIRLFPRSTTKPIWLFGDSYFSLWNDNRWPHYMFENGFTNALFNHLGGQSPTEGFEDLQNLLSLGYAPQMLVWCHGMNGNGDTYVDGQYVIDPTKKDIVDWLVDFCAKNKIVLVLATIPTALIGSTPLLHEGYNNYVRSLGVRYIDFADAVGAQPDGTWTEGLCADGVHPTVAGAKVLFARAITDCPELTIS